MDVLDHQTTSDSDITQKMQADMLGATSWQMFFAVGGALITASMMLYTVLVFKLNMIPFAILLSLLMIGFGFAAWQLYKASKGFEKFILNKNETSLEDALRAYKNYWMAHTLVIIGIILTYIIGVGYVMNMASAAF